MDDYTKQILEVGVRKLFDADAFYVCDLRTLIEVAGSCPAKSEMDKLAALHCVKWSEMPYELRNEVMRRVLSCLCIPKFAQEIATPQVNVTLNIDAPEEPERRRRFLGLFG